MRSNERTVDRRRKKKNPRRSHARETCTWEQWYAGANPSTHRFVVPCFRFAPLFISASPRVHAGIDRYPSPHPVSLPTNRRSLTTLDEAVNEHASQWANARGNEFIGGRRSIDRASERTEEGKFDRRAVRRAATSDYIYAYLMRVHNARNPCTTTRRLRAAQIAAAIPGLGGGSNRPREKTSEREREAPSAVVSER